jgi:hypothetical protein
MSRQWWCSLVPTTSTPRTTPCCQPPKRFHGCTCSAQSPNHNPDCNIKLSRQNMHACARLQHICFASCCLFLQLHLLCPVASPRPWLHNQLTETTCARVPGCIPFALPGAAYFCSCAVQPQQPNLNPGCISDSPRQNMRTCATLQPICFASRSRSSPTYSLLWLLSRSLLALSSAQPPQSLHSSLTLIDCRDSPACILP